MAYTHGDLEVRRPCPHGKGKDGYCIEDQCWPVSDSRGDYKKTYGAYLPHSCDQWVIGGPAEIRALIADLEKALEQLGES